jgi:hypothetical protein
MGGGTYRNVASMLADPAAASSSQQWASYVSHAHSKALSLHHSFTTQEQAIANLIAPRGNIISAVKNPAFVSQDLPPTLDLDVNSIA